MSHICATGHNKSFKPTSMRAAPQLRRYAIFKEWGRLLCRPLQAHAVFPWLTTASGAVSPPCPLAPDWSGSGVGPAAHTPALRCIPAFAGLSAPGLYASLFNWRGALARLGPGAAGVSAAPEASSADPAQCTGTVPSAEHADAGASGATRGHHGHSSGRQCSAGYFFCGILKRKTRSVL